MPARNDDYELLVRIAGEVDPSAQQSVATIVRLIRDARLAADEANERMARAMSMASPATLQQFNNLKYQQTMQQQAAQQAAQQYAQQQAAAAAAAQAQALAWHNQQAGAAVMNSWYQRLTYGVLGYATAMGVATRQTASWQDIAFGTFAGGILTSGFRGILNDIKGALSGLEDFVLGSIAIADNIATSQEQLRILFRNTGNTGSQVNVVSSADDAVEFARAAALQAPYVKFQDSLVAIRQLTAAGLDYTKWLKTVQNISAITANSFDDMSDRMRSVTHALANIAAGATGIGLRGLRQAGINVREAGIEFNAAGEAIGSTQEILEKLFAYMESKSSGALEGLNKRLGSLQQNTQDLIVQLREAFFAPILTPIVDRLGNAFDTLILKQDELGYTGAQKMRAYFGALGTMAGQGMEQLLSQVAGGFDQMTGPDFQNKLMQGGTRLMLSFANGIISGLNAVFQAIAWVTQTIASFLIGHSPPPEGPLSVIDKGGAAVITSWASGMLTAGAQAERAASQTAARVAAILTSGGQVSGANVFGNGPGELLAQPLPNISGILTRLESVGRSAAEAYLSGFQAGFDLGPIQSIMSTVEAALRYGVSTKAVAEDAVAGYLESFTELLYRAALEVQEFGAVTDATLGLVNASFGELADNVSRILELMGAINQVEQAIRGLEAQITAVENVIRGYEAAIDAVEAQIRQVERSVKAAQELVEVAQAQADAANAISEALDSQLAALRLQVQQFEINTSELPERYTRGRKREFDILELRLNQEKALAKVQIDAARARVEDAQKQVELLRKTIDPLRDQIQAYRDLIKGEQARIQAIRDHIKELNSQKAALTDLLKMEEMRLRLLQQQYAAAAQAAAKKAEDKGERGYFDPEIGLAATGMAAKMEELKNTWLKNLREMFGPELQRLADNWQVFVNNIADLFGPLVEEEESGLITMKDSAGARIQRAIRSIIDNFYKVRDVLSELKTKFDVMWEWVGKLHDEYNKLPKPLKDFLTLLFGYKLGGLAGVITVGFALLGWESVPDWVTKTILWSLGIRAGLSLLGMLIPIRFDILLPVLLPGIARLLATLLAGAAGIAGAVGAPALILGTLAILIAFKHDEIESSQTMADMRKWTRENTKDLDAWLLDWQNNVKDQFNFIKDNLATWARTTKADLETWLADTKRDWNLWVAETDLAVSTWAANRRADFTNWSTDTKLSIETWWADTKTGWETWTTDTAATITRWIEDRKTDLENFKNDWLTKFDNLKTGVSERIESIRLNIDTFLANLPGAWATAIENTRQAAARALDDFIDTWKDKFKDIIKPIQAVIDKLEELAGMDAPSVNIPGGGGEGASSGWDSGAGNAADPTGSYEPPLAGEFQRGGVVTRTAAYLLHQGEVVLNSQQQARLVAKMGRFAAPQLAPITISHTWNVVPDLEDRLDLENRVARVTHTALQDALGGRGRRS